MHDDPGKPGRVVHVCGPHTGETEAGGLLAPAQPGSNLEEETFLGLKETPKAVTSPSLQGKVDVKSLGCVMREIWGL